MKIFSDTVITQHITSDTSYEYDVGAGARTTLVFTMLAKKKTDAYVTVRLNGIGAMARIIGIAVGKDTSTIKFHTIQHHRAPDTTSNLLVKGALGGHATFLYDGAIRVEKEAQRANAYQRNENLLLSKDAFAESKPSLEILANNVRCTHGATISSLPEDQLWYLASRGIGNEQASRLIVTGFLESALTHLPDEPRSQVVERVLHVL